MPIRKKVIFTKPILTIFNISGLIVALLFYKLLESIILTNINLINLYLSNCNIYILTPCLFATATIHEMFHGIAYKIFGGKLKFGVKLPFCAYCADISDNMYESWKMIIILLFPAILLSLVMFIGILLFNQTVFYLGICIIINLAGATADIYYALMLATKYKDTIIKDTMDGFDIY